MSVVIVSHELTKTGAPEVAKMLWRQMSKGQLSVKLLYLRASEGEETDFKVLQREDILIPANLIKQTTLCQSQFFADRPKYVICISLASAPAAFACSRMGIPFGLACYESPSDLSHLLSNFGHKRTCMLLRRMSDSFVCGAHRDGYGATILSTIGIDESENVHFMMPPIDLETLRHAMNPTVPTEEIQAESFSGIEFSHTSDKKLAVIVGTCCTRKGFYVLRECAAHNPDWDFLWIGIHAGIPRDDTQITDNMFFTFENVQTPFGRISAMRRKSIFILASLEDPSPLTIAEAQFIGMFSVCFGSAGDGSKMIVENGGCVLPGERHVHELDQFLQSFEFESHIAPPRLSVSHNTMELSTFSDFWTHQIEEMGLAERPRRVLVHAHIGCLGQTFEDIMSKLEILVSFEKDTHQIETDVIITTYVSEIIDNISARISVLPKAHVHLVENRGADIAPFLNTLSKLKPSDYDLVLKLHSKSDDTIRMQHLSRLVPSKEGLSAILKEFNDDQRLGMVGAMPWIHPVGYGGMHAPARRKRLSKFLARCSASTLPPCRLLLPIEEILNHNRRAPFDPAEYRLLNSDLKTFSDDQLTKHWNMHGQREGRYGSFAAIETLEGPLFVGGTMFWARASVIFSMIYEMNTQSIPFEHGYTHDDDNKKGSRTHMTERLFGFACHTFGFKLRGITDNIVVVSESAPMRKIVVFVTVLDFANVATRLANGIRKVSEKYETHTISLRPHAFNYDEKHEIDLFTSNSNDHANTIRLLCDASAIVFFDEETIVGEHWSLAQLKDVWDVIKSKMEDKQHTAGFYCHSVFDNAAIDDKFALQLVVPELFEKGLPQKRRNIIPGCPMIIRTDIDDIIYARETRSSVIVMHSTSHTSNLKGSAEITAAMIRITKIFPDVVFQNVPFSNLANHEIEAMRLEADIIIDQWNNDIGGFGTTTIESLQCGCIVLCSMNLSEDFNKHFEGFPVGNIYGKEEEIFNAVENLCTKTKTELCSMMKSNIKWCQNNLTDTYVNYIEKHVLNPLVFGVQQP